MLYTQPAGSVKWDQLLAAQISITTKLFRRSSPTSSPKPIPRRLIIGSKLSINGHRQMSGWTDVWACFQSQTCWRIPQPGHRRGLYAILNQLPSIETSYQADNAEFLNKHPRGWEQGFRVTDDAPYQSVWITNSYFQALLADQTPMTTQPVHLNGSWRKPCPTVVCRPTIFPGKTTIAPISLLVPSSSMIQTCFWLTDRSMDTIGEDYNYYVQVGSEIRLLKI